MSRGLSMILAGSISLGACNEPTSGDGGSTSDAQTDSTTAGVDESDGDTTGEPSCDAANQVPDAPTVTSPTPGTRNLEPADIVIESSPFVDANADPHAATEFEIWRMGAAGPIERVWAASVTDGPSLTSITLAEGLLDGSAAVTGALETWEDHVVRVRHGDGAAGDCGWSDWSTDVPFRTDDGSAYLFDQTVMRDIYLEIPPQSWAAIDAEAVPPGCVPWQREFHPGTVTYEGEVFEGVGLRAKGGCGSARDLSDKAAFRINLGWDDPDVPGCPNTRRLHGQKHLTLNNMVQDRTFLHERMSYRLYQAFDVPTPRVAHIRVHVNGEFWGVYLLVETPKRRFLGRRFESKNGMLYEGTYWCDLLPQNVPPNDEDDYCLERKFSPSECDGSPDPDADPKDYTVLREMVDQLDAMPPGGFYPEIEGIFNFDAFLSAWAVEGVVAHWDNYGFSIMNNYRVYHHPTTDRWNLLPHGLDQTFEGELDPWEVSGILAMRCIQDPACEAAFAARFEEVNDAFESMDFVSEAEAIFDLISDDVFDDPRKSVGNFEYEQLQQEARFWIEQRPDQVRSILAAHGF